jgi:hypothetical protein
MYDLNDLINIKIPTGDKQIELKTVSFCFINPIIFSIQKYIHSSESLYTHYHHFLHSFIIDLSNATTKSIF